MKTKICLYCKKQFFPNHGLEKCCGKQTERDSCTYLYKKEMMKKHYRDNKEIYKINNKKWKENNIEKCRESVRKYYKKVYNTKEGKEKYMKSIIKYNKKRYNTDVGFRILANLRSRLYVAVKHNKKSETTLNLLGCSIENLKIHLQQTALNNGYKDFNINDYSGNKYHIDHIKPCASFDMSKEKEQKECFHYTNLQILSAKDNLIKGDRINYLNHKENLLYTW